MANLDPQEREKILKARQELNLKQEMIELEKEKKVEENLHRKHGKFLFISAIVSFSCLVLFGIIMLTLLLSDGESQLMSAGAFYGHVVRLMVLNLKVNQSVIDTISIILSIATLITGIVLSFKMLNTCKQKITSYLNSMAVIIVYIVTLALLALMMLFTLIEIFNLILLLVLAGFVTSIVFAIYDLIKTKELYKSENSITKDAN